MVLKYFYVSILINSETVYISNEINDVKEEGI